MPNPFLRQSPPIGYEEARAVQALAYAQETANLLKLVELAANNSHGVTLTHGQVPALIAQITDRLEWKP